MSEPQIILTCIVIACLLVLAFALRKSISSALKPKRKTPTPVAGGGTSGTGGTPAAGAPGTTTPTATDKGCGCLVIVVGIALVIWLGVLFTTGEILAPDWIKQKWSGSQTSQTSPAEKKVEEAKRLDYGNHQFEIVPDKWLKVSIGPRNHVKWDIVTNSGSVTYKLENGTEVTETPGHKSFFRDQYPQFIKSASGKVEICTVVITKK